MTTFRILAESMCRLKGWKISYKFLQLTLALAQRRVAIIGHRAPIVGQRQRDVQEWALVKEVHVKQSRQDDKLEDDIVAWREVLDTFLRPRDDMETIDSEDASMRAGYDVALVGVEFACIAGCMLWRKTNRISSPHLRRHGSGLSHRDWPLVAQLNGLSRYLEANAVKPDGTEEKNEARTGPTTCTQDLEQLIQERREAIHIAVVISASPLASGSDTELSQPASDRPPTPDRLSELGLTGGPPVTPATAEELF
ncbi:hypothetical protein NDU88_003495 [Pleurodeles waltl]|uniref:Uncharacterized protein n=1 Tax=Pleurodeles waltl TaxID=8319 RepID=A0AAV7M5J0_PLEWA|nr:hypothetical protein NDU88_003495 [Pleurodeles waltl]